MFDNGEFSLDDPLVYCANDPETKERYKLN